MKPEFDLHVWRPMFLERSWRVESRWVFRTAL